MFRVDASDLLLPAECVSPPFYIALSSSSVVLKGSVEQSPKGCWTAMFHWDRQKKFSIGAWRLCHQTAISEGYAQVAYGNCDDRIWAFSHLEFVRVREFVWVSWCIGRLVLPCLVWFHTDKMSRKPNLSKKIKATWELLLVFWLQTTWRHLFGFFRDMSHNSEWTCITEAFL